MISFDQLPELVTPTELAELFRTTTNSLSQDRYLGRGVPFIRAGRRILYARADILAYLDSNTFQQSPGRADVCTAVPQRD